MQQLDKDNIRGIMADILKVDVSSIDENSSMETLGSWDSANHISLVLAIEEEFDISLDISDIEKMVSFTNIVSTIDEKAGT